MNGTTAVIGVVAAIILIGGLIFFGMGGTNPFVTNVTPTQTDTTGTGQTTTTNQTQTPGVPSVVTNTTAFPSDTGAVVSGTVTPNGALTSYWFEYGTTANLGSKAATQGVGSGYSPIPAPLFISGLTKDTTYYFRLTAENQFGNVSGSVYSFHTTVGTPAPVGSAPTTKTLAASGVSRTSVNINGEVTPNKSPTQYWFEYGESASLGFVTPLQSVGDGSSVIPASLSVSNLTPATTYYFRLNAQNQFGTINGSILTFKTLGPPLSVVPVTTTQVASKVATTTATLRGTVNPYGSQTTYWFEYGTDSGFGSASTRSTSQRSAGAGTGTVSVEANLTGLHAATTYYYRTTSQNAAGTVRGDVQSFKTY